MGALSSLTEGGSSTGIVLEPGRKDIRETTIEQGTRILSEGMGEKYPNLVRQAESQNPHEQFMATLTAVMCERTERQIENARNEYGESTVTAGLGQLNRRLMDVVRIFYPNQVAALITDIQPIDRQNGEIFVIQPKFTDTAAGVTAGQEVFRNVTDGTYSSEQLTASVGTGNGTTTTFNATLTTPVRTGDVTVLVAGSQVATDDGNGNITGVGVTGSINYSTGALQVVFGTAPVNTAAITSVYLYDSESAPSNIRELEFGLNLIPVAAKQHPLKVKWSVTAQLASAAHLNIDVPDVLSNLAAQFIRTERDTSIINAINSQAPDHSNGTIGGDTTMLFNASTSGLTYNKTQFYGEIELKLNHAESIINNTMGRGGVSWILCGYNASELFKNSPSFQAIPNPAPIGPIKIGTLRDGTIDVIRVPAMNTNTYIVGYKGYMPGDSATILADWVPIYFTPVFQAPELIAARGVMSLYDLFINQANYFVKGAVSNFGA